MFAALIEELIGAGLTESEIGKYIGRSQATVNRVRNGKQRLADWETCERLRQMHRERVTPKAVANA